MKIHFTISHKRQNEAFVIDRHPIATLQLSCKPQEFQWLVANWQVVSNVDFLWSKTYYFCLAETHKGLRLATQFSVIILSDVFFILETKLFWKP